MTILNEDFQRERTVAICVFSKFPRKSFVLVFAAESIVSTTLDSNLGSDT